MRRQRFRANRIIAVILAEQSSVSPKADCSVFWVDWATLTFAAAYPDRI
jgi:hypothetical protein